MGWYLRIFGAIMSALMYALYYGYGDTFAYYAGAGQISKILKSMPLVGLEVLFENQTSYSYMANFYMNHQFIKDPAEAMIMKLGGAIGLFTFDSYMSMSFILTFFGFWGSWKLFKTFHNMYPQLHKELAISVLFIPSLFFLGGRFL